MNNDNVWSGILALMEKSITPHIFNNYLKDSKQIDLTDNSLIIEVNSKFHKDYINSKLLPEIKNKASELLNKDIAIEFKISKNKKKVTSNKTEDIHEPEIDEEKLLKKRILKSNLINQFTFNNFIVGENNRLAHAAAVAVSEKPAKAYNPLFIYGGTGLGKTHLINAIGNKLIREHKDINILYLSTEKFINDVIYAIQSSAGKMNSFSIMDSFRRKYRKLDVILIDDIHLLAGKTRTQEEFFHTFNTLYNAEKQIVLTSDRPPKEIEQLEERLRSRFQSGLLVDIGLPDLETREAILYKKAKDENINIPPDVIHFIARKIKYSIRDLEGALVKLIAVSTLLNQEIDLKLAKKSLNDYIKENIKKETPMSKIQDIVADYFGIEKKLMLSKKRTAGIVLPRQVAMYIAREITNLSTTEIGKSFGSKDHTTVLHALEKIETLRKMDKNLNEKIEKIFKELNKESV